MDFNKHTKILVPLYQYDTTNDKRYLISFRQFDKIGFMTREQKIVIPASFQLVLDEFNYEDDYVRVGKYFSKAYERKTIAPSSYIRSHYGVIDSKGKFIIPIEYEDIRPSIFCDSILFTLRSLEKGYSVVDNKGKTIVPFGKYSYIDGFDTGFARVKIGKTTNGLKDSDSRWGIIDETGFERLKPEYSSIWKFYDKCERSTIVESGSEKFKFYFWESALRNSDYNEDAEYQKEMEDYESLLNYRNETYDEYGGTYAQDVMGWSDQDIDDVLEGDPEAYWNID